MAKSKENKKKVHEPILEKDEEELALERAVFGDFEGFEAGLRNFDLDEYADDEDNNEIAGIAEANEKETENIGELQDASLFFIDEGNEENTDGISDDEKSDENEFSDDSDLTSEDEAAWTDEDDSLLKVSLSSADRLKKLRLSVNDDAVRGKEYTRRLRARFERLFPVPEWAEPQEEIENDNISSDEEMQDLDDSKFLRARDPLRDLLKSKSTYTTSGKNKTMLASGVIDIARLKDANVDARSHSAIQSLQFHPTHSLLLSAGYDRTLRLYHIDGKTNSLATSLHIRQSPFQTAQFHQDGKRVLGAGRRKYLYVWNIETGQAEKITRMYGHEDNQKSMEKFELSPCGRYIGFIGRNGWFNVLSAGTGQWVKAAKIEGIIADITWTHDGEKALLVNTAGEVWEWSSSSGEFENRWKDENGVGVTKITLSGKSNNDRYVAIGSKSGIVNIYDRHHYVIAMKLSENEAPAYKPIAVLDQLVSTISALEFSPDSQILAMASRAKKDAFRLVHVPTFTVFKNWPTSSTPLGRVTAVAFSPGCQMLCVGNSAGRCRLWNLNHYLS